MKKKILIVTLMGLLVVGVVGCSSSTNSSAEYNPPTETSLSQALSTLRDAKDRVYGNTYNERAIALGEVSNAESNIIIAEELQKLNENLEKLIEVLDK